MPRGIAGAACSCWDLHADEGFSPKAPSPTEPAALAAFCHAAGTHQDQSFPGSHQHSQCRLSPPRSGGTARCCATGPCHHQQLPVDIHGEAVVTANVSRALPHHSAPPAGSHPAAVGAPSPLGSNCCDFSMAAYTGPGKSNRRPSTKTGSGSAREQC